MNKVAQKIDIKFEEAPEVLIQPVTRVGSAPVLRRWFWPQRTLARR